MHPFLFPSIFKPTYAIIFLCYCCCGLPALFASATAAEIPQFPGTPGDWNGFARHQIDVDGKQVTIVAPAKAAEGRPWVWHGEFFGHKPAPDIELLHRGFHIVYMSIPNMLGCPAAVEHWNRCYETMTQQYHLADKVALVGLSRGGLYCYNWAIANPNKVACIYGDAPVCDFKSWPGGKGAGKGSESNWQLVLKLWDFASEEEALQYPGNPVDRLQPLAEAGVPLLHVFGDADEVVPWEENTGIIATRYKKLGGSIQLIRKPGIGHHPHGLDDSTPIVEFIEKHATPPRLKILPSTSGVQTFEIHSPYQDGPTTIRVLSPPDSNSATRAQVLFVLPVESGDGTHWGNSLEEVLKHALHIKHQLICVFPTFSDLPWYADHPSNSKCRQEQYLLDSVLPMLRWEFPLARHDRDGRLLIGFSKSGWGAWSLLLRHPDLFNKAAAWDAPLMLSKPGPYGSGSIFGTEENFRRYQVSLNVGTFKMNPADKTRLLHAGYDNFRAHHQEMNTLLTSSGIPSVYLDGPERPHHWNSGWLPGLVEQLTASEE